MLIKATNIIGLPVYTVKTGEKLDTVKDVVYDPVVNKVEALLLDKGGWFSDAKVILMPDVHSIGEDAVLIESEDMIKKASDVRQKVNNIAKGKNYLTTDKILTEDGQDLGRVSDIIFDSETGKVEEFEVSQGAVKDVSTGRKTIRTSDIITVGEDVMIVGKYTNVMFDEQAKQRGVRGAINKAQQQAPSVMSQVQQKTQELAQKTQQKAEEIKKHPRTQEAMAKMREAVDKMQVKAEEAKETVKDKTEEVKESPAMQRAQQEMRHQGMLGGKSSAKKTKKRVSRKYSKR